jgi:hypothetical protein
VNFVVSGFFSGICRRENCEETLTPDSVFQQRGFTPGKCGAGGLAGDRDAPSADHL